MAETATQPQLAEFTHEGVTVVGRDVSETDAQIREDLGLPADTQASTHPPAEPVEPPPPVEAKETAQQKHDRIQKLTWEREEAKRRAKELEDENIRLKTQPREREPEAPRTAGPKPWEDPRDPKPKSDQFETWGEYEDAKDAWLERYIERKTQYQAWAQTQQARETARNQRRHQVDSDFATALTEYSTKNPAFASKVESSDIWISEPMKAGLKATKTPQVMEFLIDNPQEVERILQMSGADQYAEMKIIASRLTAAPAGSAVTRPTTKAQPPINPVGSSPVVTKDDGEPGEDATDEEWFAWKQKTSRKRA